MESFRIQRVEYPPGVKSRFYEVETGLTNHCKVCQLKEFILYIKCSFDFRIFFESDSVLIADSLSSGCAYFVSIKVRNFTQKSLLSQTMNLQ